MNFKKKSILLAVFAILIIAVFLISNIQSTKNYEKNISENGDFTVTISIDCKTILNEYEKLDNSLKNTQYVPKNGIILNKTTVWANKGDTVLDILKKATKENNIQLEYSQSPNDSYVEGINHIYEFSCGELSGWMYKVNGNFANTGCNSYFVSENDHIQWIYTCNLGEDIGEKF